MTGAVEVETQVVDLAYQTESEMDRLQTLYAAQGVTLDAENDRPDICGAGFDYLPADSRQPGVECREVRRRESGPVELAVESVSDCAVLTVRDHGPGLGGARPKDARGALCARRRRTRFVRVPVLGSVSISCVSLCRHTEGSCRWKMGCQAVELV